MKNTENSIEFNYGKNSPFGFTSRERFLVRKHPSVWQEAWEYVWKKYEFHITLGATILFVSALTFFVTTVFHLTDIAHADAIQPDQIHTLEASCAYAGLYPEKIKNFDALQIACTAEGVPIEEITQKKPN